MTEKLIEVIDTLISYANINVEMKERLRNKLDEIRREIPKPKAEEPKKQKGKR